MKAYDALAADSSLGPAAAGSRDRARRASAGRHRAARRPQCAARAADRARSHLPPHRARAARARAWRTGDQAAAKRWFDMITDRPRDAGRHAPAHRRADRARRRARQGLSRCAVSPSSSLRRWASRWAGCDSFDPLDKFQDWDIMGSNKKPLQGERQPVFPARRARRAAGRAARAGEGLSRRRPSRRRSGRRGEEDKAEAEGRGASEAEGRSPSSRSRPQPSRNSRSSSRPLRRRTRRNAPWPAPPPPQQNSSRVAGNPRLATDLAEPGPATRHALTASHDDRIRP